MALTLEGLDRRVTALEKAAETEKNIVRAVAEIVSESEKRLTVRMQSLQEEVAHVRAEMSAAEQRLNDRMDATEQRLNDRMDATEQRLNDRMDATERRIVDVVNDKFDAVMVAIDRLDNPPT